MRPASPIARCTGCGGTRALAEQLSFACPVGRGAPHDDREHTFVLETAPGEPAAPVEAGPWLRWRRRLGSWQAARSWGIEDAQFVALVERLSASVAALDRHSRSPRGDSAKPRLPERRPRHTAPGGRESGLERADRSSGAVGKGSGSGVSPNAARATPLERAEALGAWVKNDTLQPSGSHKVRHLFGLMLWLELARMAGVPGAPADGAKLVIASCGNAALAAAVVARAAGWPLEVFVPPDAFPSVLARLREWGAKTTVCERTGGAPGDPCVRAFRRAVAEGAVPFGVQGPDNALTLDGGRTLAWEVLDAAPPDVTFDAVYVQVGGGALLSSVAQGFADAGARPRIHAVQTVGAAPLARAWRRVVARAEASTLEEALAHAAANRSAYMWPWEEAPQSLAHGILDDETYDWHAAVSAIARSGGEVVVVDDPLLERARALGQAATGIDVSHTGAAGLAGLLAHRERGLGRGEPLVLFTGASR